jgi:DNA-directed RNA polymerase subunit RPC12/RpoP
MEYVIIEKSAEGSKRAWQTRKHGGSHKEAEKPKPKGPEIDALLTKEDKLKEQALRKEVEVFSDGDLSAYVQVLRKKLQTKSWNELNDYEKRFYPLVLDEQSRRRRKALGAIFAIEIPEVRLEDVKERKSQPRKVLMNSLHVIIEKSSEGAKRAWETRRHGGKHLGPEKPKSAKKELSERVRELSDEQLQATHERLDKIPYSQMKPDERRLSHLVAYELIERKRLRPISQDPMGSLARQAAKKESDEQRLRRKGPIETPGLPEREPEVVEEFKVGDKVKHPTYGEGVVSEVRKMKTGTPVYYVKYPGRDLAFAHGDEELEKVEDVAKPKEEVSMGTKVQKLKDKIEQQQAERYAKDYPHVEPPKVTVKEGGKYIRVDVGTSGKYMVEKDTGNIYGIKGYGVIHRGHFYGTLDTIDDFNWGDYAAFRTLSLKDREFKAEKPAEPSGVVSMDTVKEDVKKMQEKINAPWVHVQSSDLGGAKNVSIIIKASMQKKEEWHNNILQNSPYTMFHLLTGGVLEQFQRSPDLDKLGAFRKTKVKSVVEAIQKINSYLNPPLPPRRKMQIKKGQMFVIIEKARKIGSKDSKKRKRRGQKEKELYEFSHKAAYGHLPSSSTPFKDDSIRFKKADIQVQPFTRTVKGKFQRVQQFFRPGKESYPGTEKGVNDFIKDHVGLSNYGHIVADEAKKEVDVDVAATNAFMSVMGHVVDKKEKPSLIAKIGSKIISRGEQPTILRQLVQKDKKAFQGLLKELFNRVHGDVREFKMEMGKSVEGMPVESVRALAVSQAMRELKKSKSPEKEEHWKCNKCGHELDAPHEEMLKRMVTCPECGGAMEELKKAGSSDAAHKAWLKREAERRALRTREREGTKLDELSGLQEAARKTRERIFAPGRTVETRGKRQLTGKVVRIVGDAQAKVQWEGGLITIEPLIDLKPKVDLDINHHDHIVKKGTSEGAKKAWSQMQHQVAKIAGVQEKVRTKQKNQEEIERQKKLKEGAKSLKRLGKLGIWGNKNDR